MEGTTRSQTGSPAYDFTGWYAHSLDAKGRMVVPQAFREQLGERFCVAPAHDFQSIALYPTDAWYEARARYERLSGVQPAVLLYLDLFNALSFRDQECDSQGRVLLPLKIRQTILGEERDVEITGAKNYVRIISSVKSQTQVADFFEHLQDTLNLIAELEREKQGKAPSVD